MFSSNFMGVLIVCIGSQHASKTKILSGQQGWTIVEFKVQMSAIGRNLKIL